MDSWNCEGKERSSVVIERRGWYHRQPTPSEAKSVLLVCGVWLGASRCGLQFEVRTQHERDYIQTNSKYLKYIFLCIVVKYAVI